MIANYVSAIKANFVLYYFNHTILDDPKIKHFLKPMKTTDCLSTQCIPGQDMVEG